MANSVVSHKVILAVGTYDGVLAGYEVNLQLQRGGDDDENNNQEKSSEQTDTTNKLKIAFVSPVHNGSIRSLMVVNNGISPSSQRTTNNHDNSSSKQQHEKLLLVSTGYDEMMRVHDFGKGVTSCGEVRTPAEFGTPVCSGFAGQTYCLVGFDDSGTVEDTVQQNKNAAVGGRLLIYKRRDWSVQHVLSGHQGGVASLAVHPTNKMALTGGLKDGKLKVWDLVRGRLAYSNSSSTKASAATRTDQEKQQRFDAIVSVVWSKEGSSYAFAHGSHVTVRDVLTGVLLLDVELPSRINQICLMEGTEGQFVAAACNDGSLAVLAIEKVGSKSTERRAIMAIEPVEGPVAGEERFKCIQSITGYHVATATSAGVVSLMNLQGAVNMISTSSENSNPDSRDDVVDDSTSDEDSDSDSEEEKELAVDILDSIRLGSGARITCLNAWAFPQKDVLPEKTTESDSTKKRPLEKSPQIADSDERKRPGGKQVMMNAEELKKARGLVSKAKKIQKRKSKKKHKISS